MPSAEPLPCSLRCQRDAFDLPADVTYLNCAYLSPLAHSVRRAGVRGVERKAHPWTLTARDFFAETNRLRELLAELLGTAATTIAIAPSASYGISTAAANLPLREGQSILVLAEQFPSNYHAWAAAAESAGARLVAVPRPTGAGSWSDDVLAAVDDSTAIISLPHVHWSDGSVFDLAAIAARGREVGAALVLDLTQSLGVVPVSVATIDPDFVVAAFYKWLLGPYSLSFLYAAPRRHGGRPLEYSWMARSDAEDFARLAEYRGGLHADARRFDVGESANLVLVPMAIAALELLSSWGIDAVGDRIGKLGDELRRATAEWGIRASGGARPAPHIIGLSLPDARPELVQRLAEEKIHVSFRGTTLRVSPHVYNDRADIERLVEALKPA